MLLRLVLLLMLAACADPPALGGSGRRWPAADQVFHQEPRWLGGDGAYAIDLGDDRTLWLFGDSFVATSPALVRTESTMVRNSVGVMTGRDPSTATMQMAWRDGSPPTSFFAEAGDHWFWPAGGIRTPSGPLVVLLTEQQASSGGLGFAAAGWKAVRVADPSGPPASWVIEPVASHAAPFDATAAIGACVAIDGDHLVALAVGGQAHDGRLARWPLTDVAAGDLDHPAWWTGAGWVDERALAGDPAIAIPDGSTECSLHRDPISGLWIHTASRGFGASTIAIRTATAVTGPWSDPGDVFTPGENDVAAPFVYAGKAHPFLTGPGLVVTYADNSFTFSDLFDPARAQTLYWPHVATLSLE